jgi:hypothetical protein
LKITETFVVDNAGERGKVENYVPEPTARENPCDTCSYSEKCAVNGTDCFAFRRWSNTGDYSDKQIKHLIRKFQDA